MFFHPILSYIDPTTTSTLLYVLIGVGASLAYACRGLFYRVRDALLARGSGASSGALEMRNMLFFGAFHGSSRSEPSWERCQMLRSML